MNILRTIYHVSNGDFLSHPDRDNCSCEPDRCSHFLPKMEALLDYIQILLFEPNQALPVLVLQSDKNDTGKTLFVKICLKAMEASGNLHWHTPLAGHPAPKRTRLIVYDEVRPKNLQTLDRRTAIIITTNMKYLDHPGYGYFICDVDEPFKQGYTVDSNFKLADEIPAFVAFLKKRLLITNREACSHFNPEMITDQQFLHRRGKRSLFPPITVNIPPQENAL